MQTADPFLVSLVRLIEQAHSDGKPTRDLPLVVNIGCLTVMGDMISTAEFAQQSKGLVKAIHELSEAAVADAIVNTDLTFDVLSDSLPKYLHLKNAVFCIPGSPQEPANSTEVFRCRLSSIDGFCLSDSL